MSIEQKIEELTAAIRENTEAVRAMGGKAATASSAGDDSATTAKRGRKPAADTESSTKTKGYEAKYTKAQAQAVANEVKEAKGVAVAKGIIQELGYNKLAEIEKPEDIDKLYEACKAKLDDEGNDDDM